MTQTCHVNKGGCETVGAAMASAASLPAEEAMSARLAEVPVPELTDPSCPADVIRSALASSVSRLFAHVPVAIVGEDPEGVHQARVATRRLRSDLRTFEPLLEPVWEARLRRELGWLADELGSVRDLDVLGRRLGRIVSGLQPDTHRVAGAVLLRRLDHERDEAHRRLVDHLRDQRALELFDHLLAAADEPHLVDTATREGRKRMRRLVRKPWRRLQRAADELGKAPAPADLHALRILAKRVRYSTEAVLAAFGPRAAKFAAAATSMQDRLGELNDAAVASVWLEKAARDVPPTSAFVAGRIAQRLDDQAMARTGEWRDSFDSMRRHSSWLES